MVWPGNAYHFGFSARQLPHIGFLHEDNPDTFSFLDPDVMIRGVHLVPVFSLGCTPDWLGPSFVQSKEDGNEDWRKFYVNM